LQFLIPASKKAVLRSVGVDFFPFANIPSHIFLSDYWSFIAPLRRRIGFFFCHREEMFHAASRPTSPGVSPDEPAYRACLLKISLP